MILSQMLLPPSPVSGEAPPPLSLPLHSEFIRHGVFNTDKKTTTYPRSYCSSSRSRGIVVVRAVKGEEESQQFEVDTEKAREALKNLDRQFQSRTQKQVRLRPKNQPAPPPVNFTRSQTKESAEEFSGEFFTYTAIALLCFTVFYNVFFYTVIKPSVDGFSEDAPTAIVATEISK